MDELSKQLLEHFLKAKPSRLLHLVSPFDQHTRDEIKKRIYALAEIGLLRKAYGEKSGAVYITTKVGREELEVIENG